MPGTFLGHWELFLRTVLFWELFLRIFNYENFTVFHGNLFLSSFLVFLPSNMVSNPKSIIQQIKIFFYYFFYFILLSNPCSRISMCAAALSLYDVLKAYFSHSYFPLLVSFQDQTANDFSFHDFAFSNIYCFE